MRFEGGQEKVDKWRGTEIVCGPVNGWVGVQSPSILEEREQFHTTSRDVSCMLYVCGNDIILDTRVR
jgi:hypothetical protein